MFTQIFTVLEKEDGWEAFDSVFYLWLIFCSVFINITTFSENMTSTIVKTKSNFFSSDGLDYATTEEILVHQFTGNLGLEPVIFLSLEKKLHKKFLQTFRVI
jgi:hypothetical protein